MNPALSAVRPDGLGLIELVQGVLAQIVSTYKAYNVPLPERQYYTVGTPVADCNQLVVSFTQMYIGLPGNEGFTPERCESPMSAVITASVFRCMPVAGARNQVVPDPPQIMAAADWALVDSAVLMASSRGCDMWDPSGLGLGVIATVASEEPQGGMVGTTMNLTLGVP